LLSDQRLGGQVIAAGGLVAVMAVIAVQIVPRRRSTAIEQMTTTASLGS